MNDQVASPLRRALLPLAATGALLAGVVASWRTFRLDDVADSGVAAIERLMTLPMTDPDGRPIDSQPWRGRHRVFNFWATWCPPCVEEMPELSELARELAPEGVQVIGIGVDNAANIRQFAQKHGISYPLTVAGAGAVELVKLLGNSSGGLPFTVTADPQGRVVHRYLGRLNMQQLREQLRQQLRG